MSDAESTFNATNRGVYIADNLDFLRTLNDESVDLICIDPPFAKAETFAADQLKPPLTQVEQENERRLLESWRVFNARDAERVGIEWPDQRSGGYKDIWSWEADIHEDWLRGLNAEWDSVAQLIEFAQVVEGDDIAAYLCYMAVRIIEVHRVLKRTGSLYLHCDDTANVYLRGLLSCVFGQDQFRQQIVWRRSPGRTSGRGWGRTHDTILYFTKSSDYVWNDTLVKSGAPSNSLPEDADAGANVNDVWTDIKLLAPTALERTGYPTQKPVRLAERMIEASSRPGDVVLDCFAGCSSVGVAAERLGGVGWLAISMYAHGQCSSVSSTRQV